MYRVIQWGTGNVGKHSLRAIIERSDMELVGVKVYSESKRGMDAGELLGGERVGITCVTDIEDILAIDADCVCFNALGSTRAGAFDATLDQLCTLLRNGFNVASSALEHLIHPAIMPSAQETLRAVCEAGASSFFDTGINPGYAMDLWPITLSRLSRSIDHVRILEVVDMNTYDSSAVLGFMGFGQPPGQRTPLDEMHLAWRSSPFYASIRQMADAMGLIVDNIRYEREEGLAGVDVEVGAGTIKAGHVVVSKLNFIGVVDGYDFFRNSWVWRVIDDIRPEWGTGDYWECQIVGDPNVTSRLELSTDFDAKRPVSLTVATLNVNAVPALCDAAPGVYTNLTMPVHAGGYRTREGTPV